MGAVACPTMAIVTFVANRVAVRCGLVVDKLKDGVLLRSAIALIVLSVVFVTFAACASPTPTTPMPQACDALEAELKQRRLELAWEIVLHQHISPLWSSEQLLEEVQKVYENLDDLAEDPET